MSVNLGRRHGRLPCHAHLSELSFLTPVVLFSADPRYKEGRIPEVPWKKWSYWCSD